MANSKKNKYMGLLNRLIDEFARGANLIDGLTDELYVKTSNGVGSVGAHFRHNIDFASNFLDGLEKGKVDYNQRERDLRVEENRQIASESIVFLIRRIILISPERLEADMKVCSELDDSNWHRSTGARELEFLHSHTVHHYALIAEKLNSMGVDVSADFGVAPSTLKFWAESDEESKVA